LNLFIVAIAAEAEAGCEIQVLAVPVSLGEILTLVAPTAVADGFVSSYKRTVIVSRAPVINAVTVNLAAVVVSELTTPEVPLWKVADPATGVEIAVFATVADDGATDRNPKPNAETTTSAKRLKLVFFDIVFLSIVVTKTFFVTAGKEFLAS
jgi:hypothetical protein